jgi:hypothetical protein
MFTWEELEDHVLEVTRGHKTAASGRLRDKGDVRTGTLLIECKMRTYADNGKPIAFAKDWLDTTLQHARDANLIPIVAFGPSYKDDYTSAVDVIYACHAEDVALFDETARRAEMKSIPLGWHLITAYSLARYCRETETDEVVHPRAGSFTGRAFNSRPNILANAGRKIPSRPFQK